MHSYNATSFNNPRNNEASVPIFVQRSLDWLFGALGVRQMGPPDYNVSNSAKPTGGTIFLTSHVGDGSVYGSASLKAGSVSPLVTSMQPLTMPRRSITSHICLSERTGTSPESSTVLLLTAGSARIWHRFLRRTKILNAATSTACVDSGKSSICSSTSSSQVADKLTP
jgi:hypothetical protein